MTWNTTNIAPNAPGLYLVYTLEGVEIGLWEDGRWYSRDGDRRIGLSHWHHLPELPA